MWQPLTCTAVLVFSGNCKVVGPRARYGSGIGEIVLSPFARAENVLAWVKPDTVESMFGPKGFPARLRSAQIGEM